MDTSEIFARNRRRWKGKGKRGMQQEQKKECRRNQERKSEEPKLPMCWLERNMFTDSTDKVS